MLTAITDYSLNATGRQIKYGVSSINDPGNPIANDSVDEEVCNTEYYGEDSEGSYLIDPDLNNILVPPVDFPLAEATNNLLSNSIDPVSKSPDMETSIYVAILELVCNIEG